MSWKRNLIIMIGVQVLAAMAWGLTNPFLPLFITELGIDDPVEQRWWAGLIQGAPLFCTALMGVIWGTVADRWGRKSMVIRGLVGTGVAMVFIRYVTNVHQLLGFRLIQGVLGGAVVVASIVRVASLAPKKRTGIAVGLMQGAVAGGFGLGPIIGGLLADRFDYRLLFAVAAVLHAIAVTIVIVLVREPRMNHEPGSEPKVRHSLSAFFGSPALLGLAASLFVVHVAITMINPVIALFTKQKLLAGSPLLEDWGNTIVGSIVCPILIVTFAAPAWGWLADRWGHRRIVLVCALLTALVLPVHALVRTVLALVMLQLLLRAFSGGLRPAARALISHLASSRQLGGLFGAVNTSVLMGVALGPFFGGWFAGRFGDRTTFVAAGVVLFFGFLMGLWLIPSASAKPVRQRETLRPEPSTAPGCRGRRISSSSVRAKISTSMKHS